MAIVAPFRGLHYNLAKVPNLTEVVTPPYDVIKPAEREAFAARNPYNMVHLILPQALPGDDRLAEPLHPGGGPFPPMAAGRGAGAGPGAGVLLLGDRFRGARAQQTRNGLAALVRLEPLSGGGIKPHEQTFSAAKADRLELFKASQAHFSPIFSIYPDPDDRVLSLLKGARPAPP